MTQNAAVYQVGREGPHLVLPGLVTAHSHAFQRALRARTQRPAGGGGSFWSWREQMYALAGQLNPDSLYAISRLAYTELALSGITAVGEFHYLHHDPAGQPYDDRLAMAESVIEAAGDAGIRIALIRAVYLRPGHNQTPHPVQRRFFDPDAATALADVAALRSRYQGREGVVIGLAAHSVRAVPAAALQEVAAFARGQALPLHIHVAEQRREVAECLAEYGRRPVQLLADLGLLEGQLVAVHATHLAPDEIEILGAARAMICLCRTTERDLGDGLPMVGPLLAAGARLCLGVDGYASSDPYEEMRAVEFDERSRTESRHAAATASGLLAAGAAGGLAALGAPPTWAEDRVRLRAADASLTGVPDEMLDEAVVYGASPRAVATVTVAGRDIVTEGVHTRYEAIRRDYESALRDLGWL